MSETIVTIYGCRGSYTVSGPSSQGFGGATSCVTVRRGDREIVLDAGTGIIDYGKQAKGDVFYVFCSHVHYDHVMGLPYFAPLYKPKNLVYLFGPRTDPYTSFEDTLQNLIQPPYHPLALFEMQSSKRFFDIGEPEVTYFFRDSVEPLKVKPQDLEELPAPGSYDMRVSCLRGYSHPKNGVNHYKVETENHTIVYATDIEGYVGGDRRLIEFARGADLLIHDAMYTRERYLSWPTTSQGYGHSTVEIAAELAEKAQVKNLCLFHHDPAHDDQAMEEVEARGRKLFANSFCARQGMVLTYS